MVITLYSFGKTKTLDKTQQIVESNIFFSQSTVANNIIPTEKWQISLEKEWFYNVARRIDFRPCLILQVNRRFIFSSPPRLHVPKICRGNFLHDKLEQ